MVRRFALGLAFGWVALVACRGVDAPAPGAEPSTGAGKPAVAARVAWDGEGPLEVVLTDFHFELGGTQVVAIGDDGRVRDYFVRSELVEVKSFCADAGPGWSGACADLVKRGETRVGTMTWFVAEYALDAAALGELRAKVVAAKLESLRDRYAEANLHDGTTRTYRVTTRAGVRRISTYSAREPVEPAGLREIATFVRTQQDRNAAVRARARVATAADRASFDALAEGKGTASPAPATSSGNP
ncbi:MAG: hypothetical protein U0183_32525 [Polyangiaceae bacterium]